jgi:hypothetical protein
MTVKYSQVSGNIASASGFNGSGGGILNSEDPPGTTSAVLTLVRTRVIHNSAGSGGYGCGIANGVLPPPPDAGFAWSAKHALLEKDARCRLERAAKRKREHAAVGRFRRELPPRRARTGGSEAISEVEREGARSSDRRVTYPRWRLEREGPLGRPFPFPGVQRWSNCQCCETWKQATSYCETDFGFLEFCGWVPA